MQIRHIAKSAILTVAAIHIHTLTVQAQEEFPSTFTFRSPKIWLGITILLVLVFLVVALIMKQLIHYAAKANKSATPQKQEEKIAYYAATLSSKQIDKFLRNRQQKKDKEKPGAVTPAMAGLACLLAGLLIPSQTTWAQAKTNTTAALLTQPGIIITLILLIIPLLGAAVILAVKVNNITKQLRNKQKMQEADKLAEHLLHLTDEEAQAILEKRKEALDYTLTNKELSGSLPAADEKGLLRIQDHVELPVVAAKKKALKRPNIDPALSKLILWYLGAAAGWLLFGTTVGEYVGIKFVAPDADQVSWLSFGRLRPVHTNAVFWGWASMAMLGLGYYIVPRVSNAPLASIKTGWYAFFLINGAVLLGTICLMAGINNGGGEYREYIWPVTLLFATGLFLTLGNFIKTIGNRKTKEIYISNWYMVSAIMFAIVITVVAYVPYWQNGLGETIIQGYYMHQGVGMWFMLFTLGIVYYFLPQQLNKPIYSYSLGIMAFWTQILFYTLIGTHHFVFSAIPWWLQTVAIVGSAGMAIPVIAGTTNFLLTIKGAWYKIKDSYTLPFFLVGIIFYFTGSMQGTAEAFRYTNLLWHFTDFTVAHSHLTMYGIISFFLWACIYAIVPRLTGKEAPQITVGVHFWMALAGMLFYTIPLMYGSTLRGMMWMEGKPFIESVKLMFPYWLWRAIGGSMMWLSHIFFAYNMYKMIYRPQTVDVREAAIQKIEKEALAV